MNDRNLNLIFIVLAFITLLIFFNYLITLTECQAVCGEYKASIQKDKCYCQTEDKLIEPMYEKVSQPIYHPFNYFYKKFSNSL